MPILRTFTVIGLLIAIALPVAAQDQNTAQQDPVQVLGVAPEIYNRIWSHIDAGDLDRALLDTSLYLLLNPTLSEAYALRGSIYEAMGETTLALQDLSIALDYTATSPENTVSTYLARANLYIEQNDLNLALADLDASLALMPDAPAPRLLRADIQLFLGNVDAAGEDYDMLIELYPEQPDFYIERGHLNFQTNEFQAALDDFSQAIHLNPDSDEAYAMRAMMLLQLGNDPSEAISDINRAIDLNPESSQYYLLRGSIRASNEEEQASAEDYFQWVMRNLTEFRSAENTLTTSQVFTVEMDLGWVYGIPFMAAAGQRVNFAAQHDADTDGVDPLLIVLDTEGLPLVADDDSGGNMDALILGYQIPDDGEYMLLVGHAAAGVQGDITIIVDLGDS